GTRAYRALLDSAAGRTETSVGLGLPRFSPLASKTISYCHFVVCSLAGEGYNFHRIVNVNVNRLGGSLDGCRFEEERGQSTYLSFANRQRPSGRNCSCHRLLYRCFRAAAFFSDTFGSGRRKKKNFHPPIPFRVPAPPPPLNSPKNEPASASTPW